MIGKKGSLILSIVASSAVIGVITASYQLKQSFSSGAGQGWGKQQAYVKAQQALILAALMVQRNVLLCSGKKPQGSQTGEGCSLFDAADTQAKDLYNELKIPTNLMQISSVPDLGQVVTLQATDPDGRPQLDRKSPFFGVKEIKWSLRSWMDPDIRSVFSSLPEYLCQKQSTYEIIPDGVCPSLDFYKDMDQLMGKEPVACRSKTISGNEISSSVCNYFSAEDFDKYMVMISVTVSYIESVVDELQGAEAEGVRAKDLILNGAVRRPVALLSLVQTNFPGKCNIPCLVAQDGGLNLNDHPQCAGFDDAGQKKLQRSFTVKNHGPGFLYDLKLRREDIEIGSNRLLAQSVVEPTVQKLAPGKEIQIQDQTPCYRSQRYGLSLEKVSCSCMSPLVYKMKNQKNLQQEFKTMCNVFKKQGGRVFSYGEEMTPKDQSKRVAVVNTRGADTQLQGQSMMAIPLACAPLQGRSKAIPAQAPKKEEVPKCGWYGEIFPAQSLECPPCKDKDCKISQVSL